MRRAVDAFHRRPPTSPAVGRALRRLGRILDPLQHHDGFTQAAKTLRQRVELFEKLRDALRLTMKPGGRNSPTTDVLPVNEAAAELRDIRKAVLKLRAWLRKNRPKRGPAEDRRKAIDIILRHLRDHGRYLWGHAISLSGAASGHLRVVDRTNNEAEHFFKGTKHDMRRQSGRKILTQDMEQFPAAAALARNLKRPDYVALVCGSLGDLPRVFAELDSQEDDAKAKRDSADPKTPDEPEITDLVSASLPRADRKFVRAPALVAKIFAASMSRAPSLDLSSG